MTKPSPNFVSFATHAFNPSQGSFRTLPGSGCFPAFAICVRGAIIPRAAAAVVAAALLLPRIALTQETQTNSPSQLFVQAVTQFAAILQPPTNQAPRTFTTTVKVIKAEGLPKGAEGGELDLAFQAPAHLRLSAKWDRQSYVAGRDGQELWVYAPGKRFGLIGSPDKAPFSTAPDAKDTKPLDPLKPIFDSLKS